MDEEGEQLIFTRLDPYTIDLARKQRSFKGIRGEIEVFKRIPRSVDATAESSDDDHLRNSVMIWIYQIVL